MSRYRDGDVAAFEILYTRHKAPLYRFFLRRGVSSDSAAELFQEVWIKIIRAKDRYQPTAKFTTYMYRLAHTSFVDWMRHQARTPQRNPGPDRVEPDEISGDARDDPATGAERSESLERLRQALAELPAEQQEAFILREEGNLSLAEIAAVTGVNSETAKSRLRYAVKKLRRVLNSPDDPT